MISSLMTASRMIARSWTMTAALLRSPLQSSRLLSGRLLSGNAASWLAGYLADAVVSALVLALAAWVLAHWMRRLGPALQHRMWVGALAAQLLLPALMVRPVRLWGPTADAGRALVTVVMGDGAAGSVHPRPGWVAALGVAYLAITLFFTLRLLWGIWQVRRLAAQTQAAELSPAAQALWLRYCEYFGVEETAVRVSAAVGTPVTTGIWRRLLILPLEFPERTREDEMAAAMAHECAHMQRRDFAKNLLYRALCLPLAWHPAVWFTLRRVTASREMVCDALAATATAGPQRYARALLALAKRALARQPHPYAIGVCDANRFEERVMRLIESRTEMQGARRLVLAAMCAIAGCGTLALAAGMKVSVAMPATAGQNEAQGDQHTARVSGGVMAGQLLSKVAPVYPQEAKDAKISGSVVLHAVIGTDGRIESLQVVSGPDVLAQSALDAVKQWVYKPFLINGAPTAVDTNITVNFSMR